MKINGIVEIRRIIELSVYKNLKHVLIRPNLQVHLMNAWINVILELSNYRFEGSAFTMNQSLEILTVSSRYMP